MINSRQRVEIAYLGGGGGGLLNSRLSSGLGGRLLLGQLHGTRGTYEERVSIRSKHKSKDEENPARSCKNKQH